jgi:protoporphyrinogen/coproporphyrinogen III oxidase
LSTPTRRLAVVGAGVSGLAAAGELVRLAEKSATPISLSVFEAADRAGGKVLTIEFVGADVDLGSESLLARDPVVEETIAKLGLSSSLIRPATTSASIWNGRRMIAIPKDSVLGVPLYPWRVDVVRALGPIGAARASLEPWLRHPKPSPDGPLGEFLRRRVGRTVLARLVDPLLGGVYAGPARDLSTGAVAPQLLAAAEEGGSLLQGLRHVRRPVASAPGPTPFVSFDGGLAKLVGGLLDALPRDAVRVASSVVAIETPGPDRIRVESQGRSKADFDGVVLALPAPAAAALLSPISDRIGALLRHLEYASVATVTLAYPDAAFGRPLLGSGFLVAPRPRRTVTACTFMDRKWPGLRQPGLTILRISVGSFGDEWALALDDATLVTSIHRELRTILGLSQLPVGARVQRWHGSLPQYRTGHLAWRSQVATAAAALPAPIELTGAAFGGIGIAACLREGATSARTLWERLQPH